MEDFGELVLVLAAILVAAFAASLFTGWLLMVTLGAVLGGYGIVGPGLFMSWLLAFTLSLITSGNYSN